ncbi:MgtC/SapB family protein [Halobaculum sp. D14]|uniref:MgtC/SapB family protein n=1 Tax=Halobaculum sp. D14 TaxID=3421642 RepID=UPI003EB76234
MATVETFLAAPLSEPVVRLVLAAALGLFLGLEREWSQKSAGIRTFSLTSLVAAVFTLLAEQSTVGESLLVVGGVLVIVQGVLLAARGLRMGSEYESLSLTTSVSLLAAYGVGALVAAGYILEGVTVAVVSSTLLVLKRELHGFAGGLRREELRSMTEFAILAFVVYPLLPAGEMAVYGVPFEPRVAWLMVVTVAGIGMANYALIRTYGGRGIAVTGFFGGLASSTAVVGSMLDYVTEREDAVSYAVAAVLLADAAMALRNLAIAVAFTVGTDAPVLAGALVPLGVVVLGSVAVAAVTADWREHVDVDLESPFSLRNALAFGSVFLFILAGSTVAQSEFGTAGLYVTAAVSGLVSSSGATTSAVLLYRGGAIDSHTAVVAVLLATASSVVVKAGLAAAGPRTFARRVAAWSAALLVAAGVATVVTGLP